MKTQVTVTVICGAALLIVSLLVVSRKSTQPGADKETVAMQIADEGSDKTPTHPSGIRFIPSGKSLPEEWKPDAISAENVRGKLPENLRPEAPMISNYFREKEAAAAGRAPFKRADEIEIPENATAEVELKILGQKADANLALAQQIIAETAPYERLAQNIGGEAAAQVLRFEQVESVADQLSFLDRRGKDTGHRQAASILLEVKEGRGGTFDDRRGDLTGQLGEEFISRHEKFLRLLAKDRMPRGTVTR